MSDDSIKENTLGGKKEALSKALHEEEPVKQEKTFIPPETTVAKQEEIEAIIINGGDIVKDSLDRVAGLTYKTPEAAPKAKRFGFEDITIDDVDDALADHEKKAEYFRNLRNFLQRYNGMNKEEIKKEAEAGLKYIEFLDKH